MQRDDFDKIEPECTFDECYPHEIRALYDLGSQDGYGCIKCKAVYTDRASFKVKGTWSRRTRRSSVSSGNQK